MAFCDSPGAIVHHQTRICFSATGVLSAITWPRKFSPSHITAWLALEKIIVGAKADAAVRLKPKPLASAIQSQREVDIRFLPWNARPSLAPGLLGHLGDPVIERPRAVRFLLCLHCGIS